MLHLEYLTEKSNFIEFAKSLPTDDKPSKRENLNNYLDSIIKNNTFMHLGEKRENLYFNWLENLYCKLHPKY